MSETSGPAWRSAPSERLARSEPSEPPERPGWPSWSEPGPGPVDVAPVPQTMVVPRRRPGWVPAAVAGLAAAVLGIGVGQLWRVVAPHVEIVKAERGFLYAPHIQPEQAMAADGWFAFLGVLAGLLAAVAAWIFLRRQRGVAVMVALVLGSLVGAWLGWWLGVHLEAARFEALAAAAPIGAHLDAPLSLRITDLDREQVWPVGLARPYVKLTGVVGAQALATAVVYTVLAGFATDPDLRPGRPEPESLSPWGEDGPAPGSGGRVDQLGPSEHPRFSTPPGLSSTPGLSNTPGLNSDRDAPPGPPNSPARP